jgi:hypothetical protein
LGKSVEEFLLFPRQACDAHQKLVDARLKPLGFFRVEQAQHGL